MLYQHHETNEKYGQSLKVNCHNSRTSDDIDMKLGPVTKLEKFFDDDIMLEHCDVIVIFPIYDQFGAIRSKPDSGRIVCKTYIFIKSNLLFYNT